MQGPRAACASKVKTRSAMQVPGTGRYQIFFAGSSFAPSSYLKRMPREFCVLPETLILRVNLLALTESKWVSASHRGSGPGAFRDYYETQFRKWSREANPLADAFSIYVRAFRRDALSGVTKRSCIRFNASSYRWGAKPRL